MDGPPDHAEQGNFVGDDTWSPYDGDEIYSDYTIDGQDVTVTAWYEPGVGMVEDVSGTPVVKYYHDNLIGTTRFMTDASGSKIEGGVYTAFGELVSGDPRRFGYAGAWGYQTDVAPDSAPPTSDMPFVHVGHRYYNPSSGRLLQRDPIGLAGGMNVYAYVANTPTVDIDPQGLQRAVRPFRPGPPGPRLPYRPPGLDVINAPDTPIPPEGVPPVPENLLTLLCGGPYVPATPPKSGEGPCSCGKPPRNQHHLHAAPPRRPRPRPRPRPSGPLLGPGGCFVAGTLVWTPTGAMVIEKVANGEELLASVTNGTTQHASATVTATMSFWRDELVTVMLDNETIRCTAEHPFWVVDRGWVEAGRLTPSDELYSAVGAAVKINAIERERCPHPVRVYNVTVDRTHVYFMGEAQVLVHNKHQY